MHYCCLVITKEFPTDEVIKRILDPFSDDNYYTGDCVEDKPRPAFMWDWFQVGGRYNGHFKLDTAEGCNEEYELRYYAKVPRAGRLFRSFLLEKMMKWHESMSGFSKVRYGNGLDFHEEDFFGSIGGNDGFLYVDGAKIKDIRDWEEVKRNCYCFVDKDGYGYARESWDGEHWVENDDFDQQINSRCSLEGNAGCYACVVDIHD